MEEGRGEEEHAVEGGVSQHHIKKRALKNKALTISFDEKHLRDFVGGFHKRKQKRRKEAQQQIQDKERKLRIEKRKQRKQEREYVQGGAPANGSGPDKSNTNLEEDEEDEPYLPNSVEETKTYDTGDLTIMVKTSEISREEDSILKEKTHPIRKLSGEAENKHNVPVKKKQPTFKRTGKRRSGPKLQKKRDKRKGNMKEMR